MIPTPSDPDVLTEDEAAAFLRVSIRTLQAWRTKRVGPSFMRLGRLIRYRRQALIDFMNENTELTDSLDD